MIIERPTLNHLRVTCQLLMHIPIEEGVGKVRGDHAKECYLASLNGDCPKEALAEEQ